MLIIVKVNTHSYNGGWKVRRKQTPRLEKLIDEVTAQQEIDEAKREASDTNTSNYLNGLCFLSHFFAKQIMEEVAVKEWDRQFGHCFPDLMEVSLNLALVSLAL